MGPGGSGRGPSRGDSQSLGWDSFPAGGQGPSAALGVLPFFLSGRNIRVLQAGWPLVAGPCRLLGRGGRPGDQ